MNRAKKIEFLKGLASGTRSIKEILPEEAMRLEIWFGHDDGIYHQHQFFNTSKCDEKLTYEELKRREKLLKFHLRICEFKSFA